MNDGSIDLSDQYDTSKQLLDGDVTPYFERFEAESARARQVVPCETLRYGFAEREVFDFFAAPFSGAPLFVWLHGGYWRRMSKDAFSFVAPPLVAAGVSVAVLNYPLAPGPTLDAIGASARAGFAAARRRAESRGGGEKCYAGGHSVGAQLAATIAHGYSLGGLFALSGLYDLEPLRHTHINEWIAMDAETAARNAPLLLRPLGTPPLTIACGGKEQAEFHRQQRDYTAAWRAWGGDVVEIARPQDDHFSIVLELGDPKSPLVRALLDLVRR